MRHLGDTCRDREEICEKPTGCHGSVVDCNEQEALLSFFPFS